MTQTQKFNDIFGRIRDDDNVDILYVDEGEIVTCLDADVVPVGSCLSARHHRDAHAKGIVLTRADANTLGIEIEDGK
jgi:hypothetical protein